MHSSGKFAGLHGCRLGTQPKGIGDEPGAQVAVGAELLCRLGTQPKGIGDM